ncbi:hypothetical protein [Actibacterium sp. D379-3]
MENGKKTRSRLVILTGVSAIALAALTTSVPDFESHLTLVGPAFAESHSGGGQGQGGGDHADDGTDHTHDDGDDHTHDDGDDHEGGKGKQGSNAGGTQGGQGGDGGSGGSEGQGPKAGKPTGSQGGKPAWAEEGIPEVELGRLNVARSPDHVLDRAYDEALAGFTAEMAEFYSMSLDEAIAALSLDYDNQEFIDSPLQNLALFEEALDGQSVLNTLPSVTNSNDTLLAMFLGTASDKTIPVTTDTVIAVTTILGTEVTESQAANIAQDAEAVRIAVLAGHG